MSLFPNSLPQPMQPSMPLQPPTPGRELVPSGDSLAPTPPTRITVTHPSHKPAADLAVPGVQYEGTGFGIPSHVGAELDLQPQPQAAQADLGPNSPAGDGTDTGSEPVPYVAIPTSDGTVYMPGDKAQYVLGESAVQPTEAGAASAASQEPTPYVAPAEQPDEPTQPSPQEPSAEDAAPTPDTPNPDARPLQDPGIDVEAIVGRALARAGLDDMVQAPQADDIAAEPREAPRPPAPTEYPSATEPSDAATVEIQTITFDDKPANTTEKDQPADITNTPPEDDNTLGEEHADLKRRIQEFTDDARTQALPPATAEDTVLPANPASQPPTPMDRPAPLTNTPPSELARATLTGRTVPDPTLPREAAADASERWAAFREGVHAAGSSALTGAEVEPAITEPGTADSQPANPLSPVEAQQPQTAEDAIRAARQQGTPLVVRPDELPPAPNHLDPAQIVQDLRERNATLGAQSDDPVDDLLTRLSTGLSNLGRTTDAPATVGTAEDAVRALSGDPTQAAEALRRFDNTTAPTDYFTRGDASPQGGDAPTIEGPTSNEA